MAGYPARPAWKASRRRHWFAVLRAGALCQLGGDLIGQLEGGLAPAGPVQQVDRGPDPGFQPEHGAAR